MTENNNSEVGTSKVATFYSVNGWWYAAGGLMLLVAIGLIAILVLPNHHDANTAAPTNAAGTPPLSSPATPQASTSPAGTGWADLGCNGTKGSIETPVLAPKGSWVPLGAMSVPASETFGPAAVEGFVRTCYQHTPTGAVFAAENLPIAAATAPTPDRAAVLEAGMTPGAQRDASLSEIEGPLGWKPAAFHVDSCDPQRCNIVLVVSAGGGFAEINMPMVWYLGDWRLDGSRDAGGGSVDAVPVGFVNWAA